MSFIGAVVLLWLAKQIWAIRKLSDKGELFNFQKIFVLTIFNGPLWIVWSTVCVPQAYILNQQIPGGSILFLVIFEIGWFASTVLLTFIFSRFRNLLVKENVVSLVFKFFALVLIFFSLRLVVTSIMFFAK
jgi:threonine/homoserine/homoserine lactone efflux protein